MTRRARTGSRVGLGHDHCGGGHERFQRGRSVVSEGLTFESGLNGLLSWPSELGDEVGRSLMGHEATEDLLGVVRRFRGAVAVVVGVCRRAAEASSDEHVERSSSPQEGGRKEPTLLEGESMHARPVGVDQAHVHHVLRRPSGGVEQTSDPRRAGIWPTRGTTRLQQLLGR